MIDTAILTPNEVTLALYGAPHLGDALCATSLPRLLTTRRRWGVYMNKHQRSIASAFANNPYVCGFVEGWTVDPFTRLRGTGHVIQRLQQAFGLPVQRTPKPEVYLSEEELAWARQQRSTWPSDRPACIFSVRVLTDTGSFDFSKVNWAALAKQWSRYCTIIQPVLTQPKLYQEQVSPLPHVVANTWEPEPILPDAVVYRDLSVRQYLSLFAVADYFCGGTSGGSHAAAAFDLPALIVVWRDLLRRLRFPCRDPHLSPGIFIYPQHRHIEAERVCLPHADHGEIERAIGEVIDGKAENAIGRYPLAGRTLIVRNPRGALRRLPRSSASAWGQDAA